MGKERVTCPGRAVRVRRAAVEGDTLAGVQPSPPPESPSCISRSPPCHRFAGLPDPSPVVIKGTSIPCAASSCQPGPRGRRCAAPRVALPAPLPAFRDEDLTAEAENRSATKGLATVALLKMNFDAGRDHIGMFEPFVLDTLGQMDSETYGVEEVREAVVARHQLALPSEHGANSSLAPRKTGLPTP